MPRLGDATNPAARYSGWPAGSASSVMNAPGGATSWIRAIRWSSTRRPRPALMRAASPCRRCENTRPPSPITRRASRRCDLRRRARVQKRQLLRAPRACVRRLFVPAASRASVHARRRSRSACDAVTRRLARTPSSVATQRSSARCGCFVLGVGAGGLARRSASRRRARSRRGSRARGSRSCRSRAS